MPPRQRPPIPTPTRFNPLDPDEIGRSLREKIDSQEVKSFPLPEFRGAGLYALYWAGNFPLYERLKNTHVPLYVGKAEAGSSRYGYAPDYEESKLWDRILKHSKSIQEVEGSSDANIRLSDFRVRYLPLDDAWIVLGERALLRQYRPVLWNSFLDGFGSNPPGAARKNARSSWDTIHPGRARAGQLPHRQYTRDEMLQGVERAIEISLMPPTDTREAAVTAFRRDRPPVIWQLAKSRDPDKRLRIFDPQRFFAEADRLGVSLDESEYRIMSTVEVREAESELLQESFDID
ncbi:Eco29kI family restriction endonuclease [Micromonospora chalcea]